MRASYAKRVQRRLPMNSNSVVNATTLENKSQVPDWFVLTVVFLSLVLGGSLTYPY